MSSTKKKSKTLQQLQAQLQKETAQDTVNKTTGLILTAIFVALLVAGIIGLTLSTGTGSVMALGLLGTMFGATLGPFAGVLTGAEYLNPNNTLENAKTRVKNQETRLPISNLMMREEVPRFVEYYSKNAAALQAALKKKLSQIEQSLEENEKLDQKLVTTQLEKEQAVLRLEQEELSQNSKYRPNLSLDKAMLEGFFKQEISQIEKSLKLNETLKEKADPTALNARKKRLEEAETLLLGTSELPVEQRLNRLVELLAGEQFQ